MPTKQSYEDLKVWQAAMELVEITYAKLVHFPKEEQYALTAQLRRCAISIPSNIAEGSARGKKEFSHFLRIASGSVAEYKTQIQIAYRVGYLTLEQYNLLMDKAITTSKMLAGLRNSIKETENG